MNPTPIAWMNKNHEDIHIAITQEDYNRQPTFIQKQWEGSAPLFTLDQLNQAKADALREAAELCDELETHYAGYADTALLNGDVALSNAASGEPRAARFIAEKLRKMAEEMEKGK